MLITNREYQGMLCQWVDEKIWQGFKPHLLTLMFNPIAAPTSQWRSIMISEIERTYATILTRFERDPRNVDSFNLPFWMLSPDWPVPKFSRKNRLPDVFINDGLHFHGIAMTRQNSRKGETLSRHLQSEQSRYAGRRKPIAYIDALDITETPERAVGYVTKSLSRGRISNEGIVILPRTQSEMPASW